jgi:hypothetical protein
VLDGPVFLLWEVHACVPGMRRSGSGLCSWARRPVLVVFLTRWSPDPYVTLAPPCDELCATSSLLSFPPYLCPHDAVTNERVSLRHQVLEIAENTPCDVEVVAELQVDEWPIGHKLRVPRSRSGAAWRVRRAQACASLRKLVPRICREGHARFFGG